MGMSGARGTGVYQRAEILLTGLLAKRALTPTGSHVIVGAPGRGMFGPLRVALKAAMFKPFVKENVAMMMARPGQADLALIGDLISCRPSCVPASRPAGRF
jgi:hypothetical protein